MKSEDQSRKQTSNSARFLFLHAITYCILNLEQHLFCHRLRMVSHDIEPSFTVFGGAVFYVRFVSIAKSFDVFPGVKCGRSIWFRCIWLQKKKTNFITS